MIVTSKVSLPEYPGSGVYVYEPSFPTSTVPWPGSVLSVTVRPVPVAPSSTPSSAGTTRVPSAVASASVAATTGVMVTVTVPAACSSFAPVTPYGKVAVPEVPEPGCT